MKCSYVHAINTVDCKTPIAVAKHRRLDTKKTCLWKYDQQQQYQYQYQKAFQIN